MSGSKRLLLAAIVAGVMFVRPPVFTTLGAQKPTFRVATEAVWVTATVIDNDGRLVTDLTKDDFEIRDNGEMREITVFRNDVVPFSIAILFDISGSMIENSYVMRRGVTELIARFQPGDRATIGMFWGLTEISPRFTANPKTLLGWVNATVGGVGTPCASSMANAKWPFAAMLPRGGATAIWDAVNCGIEVVGSDAETPRRVVMVITDGNDNMSGLNAKDVESFANQYGVMVYAIGMNGSEGLDDSRLRTLAEETGGGYFHLIDRNDLPATFARVAEELRHQYLFGFTPAANGPSAHKLEVRARRPNATTRSRRVYMEAVPFTTAASAPAPAAAPAAGVPSASIAPARSSAPEMLDRYERGDRTAGAASYRSSAEILTALEDLQKSAPVWIGARAGQEARRRLAVAAYVLDLIDANVNILADGHVRSVRIAQGESGLLGQVPLSAADLVEWACGLLREDPPSPPERMWHLASVATLERFRADGAFDVHLGHAEQRFPGDPELALARAISQELRTWPERRDNPGFSAPSGFLASRVEARFKEAAALEPVRQEAQLRWGHFELRRGNVDAALAHFDEVGEPADLFLRYWLHLFRGRAFEQAGRWSDAVASYRLAFSAVPYAQSATVALGAALVANHRPDEAAALVTRMLTVQPPPLDPWRLYTFPAWRAWPKRLADLRDAIKP